MARYWIYRGAWSLHFGFSDSPGLVYGCRVQGFEHRGAFGLVAIVVSVTFCCS